MDAAAVIRRRIVLAGLCQAEGGITCNEAARRLHVVPQTVKIDLDWMADNGIPVRPDKLSRGRVPVVWTLSPDWLAGLWLYRRFIKNGKELFPYECD